MARRVCKTLTLAERVQVLKRLENNESQSSVALEFGVNQSAISRIQKNKERITEEWRNNSNPDRKRKRGGKSEDVEIALLRWFSQAHSLQVPVSGPLLMEKADQLAHGLGMTDFKATSGWLERWKARNAIQFKRQHGKKKDVKDFETEQRVTEVLPLPGILKQESNDEPGGNGGETEAYAPSCRTADNFSRFIAVNDGLSTQDEISKSSIISSPEQMSHQEDEESSFDDDVATAPVSFATVTHCLHIVRQFMEQKGCESYEPLYELESVIHRINSQAAVQMSISKIRPWHVRESS